MDLEAVRIFVRVAELRSLSAASRALGVPKSTVSRALARLEEELGTRLLQRDTRKVGLTDAGTVFHRHGLRLLADAEEAADALASLAERPRGLLRVGAPFTFGRALLAPRLGAFAVEHPEVRVELVMSMRQVDPIAEELDVAVRVGPSSDSGLVARRLAAVPIGLYASPDYLARAGGAPARPEDLAAHDLVDFRHEEAAPGAESAWSLVSAAGEKREVGFVPRVAINDPSTMAEAAVGGAGIVLAPAFLCAEAVAGGRLVRVLPDWSMPPPDIHAVFASRRGLSPKVRVFVDFLVRALRTDA